MAGDDRQDGEHQAQRLVAELGRGARELADVTVLSLSVRERVDLLVGVERAARAMEAARLAVIRCLDGEDMRCVEAANLPGLLQSALGTAPGRARADVDAARATDPDASTTGVLRDERGALAGMGEALREGAVSRDHVDAARRTLDRVPQSLRAGAAVTIDEFFLAVSRRHPPRACENLAAQLLDRLDPTRSERGYDPDAFARRRLDLVVDSTGMLLVRGQLDPMTGAQLKAAVEHFAAPDPARPDAATSDGGAGGPGARDEGALSLGRDPRTPSQRRADALGIVARQGLAAAGTRGGEAPRVVVHATLDQLAALTAGSDHGQQAAAGRAWCEQTGFITPDVLTRIGCGALFERVLTAPNGAVLRLGRSARLASAAQRRALAARDHGCVAPGCTRPPTQCDAHHTTSWVTGGLTDIDGLVLLCGPHHNAVHTGDLAVRIRDGVPWVRLPASVDPERPWVRPTQRDDAAHARRLGHQARLDLGLDPPPRPGGAPTSSTPADAVPPGAAAGPPRHPWVRPRAGPEADQDDDELGAA